MCGCGQYYSINPCGFPYKNTRGNCIICGNKIGYDELPPGIKGTHVFAHVPGHYRIFKDENQHQTCMSQYNDSDINIPNMTLENYKKNIIEPLIKNNKGLNIVTKEHFLKRNKIIRNLSKLSYRILN